MHHATVSALVFGIAAGLVTGCGVEPNSPDSEEASAVAAVSATAVPGITYNIINELRGFVCLAGRSNNKAQTSTCNTDFADQNWQLRPAGAAGFFQLVVQIDQRCLAFTSGADSTEGRISSCDPSFTNQWWRLDPTLDSDRFMLRNFATNKCLVLRANATVATESGCSLSFVDQWWTFFPRS